MYYKSEKSFSDIPTKINQGIKNSNKAKNSALVNGR